MQNTTRKDGKQKLSCTTPWGTFTRTTAHLYTHVLVVGGYRVDLLQAALTDARRRNPKPAPHVANFIERLEVRIRDAEQAERENKGYDFSWHHTAMAARKTSQSCPSVVRGIFPVDGTVKCNCAGLSPATCALTTQEVL